MYSGDDEKNLSFQLYKTLYFVGTLVIVVSLEIMSQIRKKFEIKKLAQEITGKYQSTGTKPPKTIK